MLLHQVGLGGHLLPGSFPLSQMVSLAHEVQEFSLAKKQEVTSFSKNPVIGLIPSKPGLMEILCYSYCYVGLMTGTRGILWWAGSQDAWGPSQLGRGVRFGAGGWKPGHLGSVQPQGGARHLLRRQKAG